MSTFHKSNLGQFGENLPCDMDGFVHTTIAGWMAANVDFGGETWTREQLRDWAREKAQEARAAVKKAEASLREWQSVEA